MNRNLIIPIKLTVRFRCSRTEYGETIDMHLAVNHGFICSRCLDEDVHSSASTLAASSSSNNNISDLLERVIMQHVIDQSVCHTGVVSLTKSPPYWYVRRGETDRLDRGDPTEVRSTAMFPWRIVNYLFNQRVAVASVCRRHQQTDRPNTRRTSALCVGTWRTTACSCCGPLCDDRSTSVIALLDTTTGPHMRLLHMAVCLPWRYRRIRLMFLTNQFDCFTVWSGNALFWGHAFADWYTFRSVKFNYTVVKSFVLYDLH